MMKSGKLILPLVLLVLCGATAHANSLASCPIANSPFHLNTGGERLTGHTVTPVTVKKFFDALSRGTQPNTTTVTWERMKDNFYVFNAKTEFIGAKPTENIKFGIAVLPNGNAVLTDFWGIDGKLRSAEQVTGVFLPHYIQADK
jgi:hypothetical protein